jgi:integrase
MAWIVWHTGRDGARTAYVQWRDRATRRVKSRALGAVDALTAEVECRAATVALEGKAPRAKWLAPAKLVAAFLGHLKAKGDRPATLAMYRQVLDPLLEAWQGTPLQRWSRPMLEVYLAQHPQWAPRTAQMLVNACRHLIRWAGETGLGCPDFVGRLRSAPVVREAPKIWEPHEVAAILRVATDPKRASTYAVPIHLAALAGLSFGDIRSLTRREVDLEGGWITRARGRQKTGAKLRVAIVPALRAVLEPRQGTPDALVCPGLPELRKGPGWALCRACKAAGVPSGGWHRFRHSLASAMDAAGVGVGAISRALAHRPGSTQTLRYVTALDRQVADGMGKAAETFKAREA